MPQASSPPNGDRWNEFAYVLPIIFRLVRIVDGAPRKRLGKGKESQQKNDSDHDRDEEDARRAGWAGDGEHCEMLCRRRLEMSLKGMEEEKGEEKKSCPSQVQEDKAHSAGRGGGLDSRANKTCNAAQYLALRHRLPRR